MTENLMLAIAAIGILGSLAQGAQIKTTLFTQEYGHEAYLTQHGKNVIPMFGISLGGKQLNVFTRKDKYRKAG